MKKKTDRHPIPEEHGRAFMATLWTLVKAFGLDKYPSVCHYLQLAGDEINRALFEQRSPPQTHHRDEMERKKFIINYKTRWLEMTGYQHDQALTSLDAHLISQICKNLTDKGFAPEEYLKWLFDIYLPANDKFCPPQLKWVCSGFAVNKFLYDNRDEMQNRKVAAVRSKMALDLVNRARVCMRTVKDAAEVEKLKEVTKKFCDGGIVIEEMRKLVESYEEANHGSNPAQ